MDTKDIKVLEVHKNQKFVVLRLSCDDICPVLVGILPDGRLSIDYKGEPVIIDFSK